MSEKQEQVINAIVLGLSRIGAVQFVGNEIKVKVTAQWPGENDAVFVVAVQEIRP